MQRKIGIIIMLSAFSVSAMAGGGGRACQREGVTKWDEIKYKNYPYYFYLIPNLVFKVGNV